MSGRIAIVSPVVDTGAVPMERVLADLDGGGWPISHRFLDGGPASIENEAEAKQCIPWLVQAAEAEVAAGGVEALIVNCMCDPGVAALRACLAVPVVGPAEACMHLLAGLGLRFSVLDVVEEARDEVEAQVRGFGLGHAFASHRAIRVPVLDIHKDRARSATALHAQAVAAIEVDGAQALLLGCTGFSDLAADLRALMAGGPDVPVIEPLQTAVALAAMLATARPGERTRMSQVAADDTGGAGLAGALSRRIGEPRRLAAAFAATALAYLPSLTLPWAISGLVSRLGLSTTAAGSLVTIQLAVLSAVAIGAGFVVDRLPKRAAVMFGAAAGLAGALIVLFGPPGLLLAGMVVAGAGFGLCCAVGNALIGGASQPGRLSANLWFLLLIAQAIIWYATPLVAARQGLAGVYAVIVIAAVILSPLLLVTPAASAPQVARTGVAETGAKARLDWPAFVLMAACAIAFWLRDSATWTLAAQRGTALGVSDQQMAMTLLGCTLLGFAGPAAASFMGDRLGRTRTLLLGLVVLALVMTAIAAARTPLLYRLGFLLWTAASTFAWTYVLEIAALLDRRGRIAAVSGGLMFAAAAIGPLIGGGLLDAWHGAALPIGITALGVLTLLAAAPAALRVRAATSAETGSPRP